MVRFCGDKDGVKGHRGIQLVMLSRESSPLPLKEEKTAEGRIREEQTEQLLQVQLHLFLFTGAVCSVTKTQLIGQKVCHK